VLLRTSKFFWKGQLVYYLQHWSIKKLVYKKLSLNRKSKEIPDILIDLKLFCKCLCPRVWNKNCLYILNFYNILYVVSRAIELLQDRSLIDKYFLIYFPNLTHMNFKLNISFINTLIQNENNFVTLC
jgi:hypothetical protein